MKNEITLRLWRLLTIFAVLAIFVSSCQKEETIAPETTNEKSTVDPLVKSAIEWYSQHSQNTKERSAKDFSLNDFRADWSTVTISKNSKGVPIVNVKLVNQDEYYADSRFMELSVAVDQSGQSVGMVKEFLTNPYEANAKMNVYTGDGDFFVSGEYNKNDAQIQEEEGVVESGWMRLLLQNLFLVALTPMGQKFLHLLQIHQQCLLDRLPEAEEIRHQGRNWERTGL